MQAQMDTYNNNVQIPSLEEAKNYIFSIDFSQIINKLVNHCGWSTSNAKMVSLMYRRFLFLKKKYGEKYTLPPSQEIDEFWHSHILDTIQYRKDCYAIFGYFLEHYPYLVIDGKSNENDLISWFEETKFLYQREFGEPIKAVGRCRFTVKLINMLKSLNTLPTKIALKKIIKGK